MTTKFKNKQLSDMIQSNRIGECLAGSRAYGTDIITSDWDYRGIFVADPHYIRTPFYTVNEATYQDQEDTKDYELNKLIKLAVDCNPNILELLHVDQQDVTLDTPEYKLIRETAPRLLSQRVAYTYTGYAVSQWKRIKGHDRWMTLMNNGIDKFIDMIENGQLTRQHLEMLVKDWAFELIMTKVTKSCSSPTVVDVNTIESTIFNNQDTMLLTNIGPRQQDYVSVVFDMNTSDKSNDIAQLQDGHQFVPLSTSEEGRLFCVYKSDNPHSKLFNGDGKLNVSDPITNDTRPVVAIAKFALQLYKDHLDNYNKFHNWKTNRNATRHQLEVDFGYDTKHGSHIVRLLTTGRELLETGQLHVRRPDAQFLKDIRAGKWSYRELEEFVTDMDDHIRNKSLKGTTLPKHINLEIPTQLILDIQDSIWSNK